MKLGLNNFKVNFDIKQYKNAKSDTVCSYDVGRHNMDFILHLEFNFYWTGPKEKRQFGDWNAICNSFDIVIGNILYL